MKRQVVVTGIGAVTPLGIGARTLYESWRAGVSGIQNGEGVATEFNPSDHLSVREARRADRFSQFAMVAGDEALDQAGWDREELPYVRDRIGCVFGTGIGGIGTLERGKEILLEKGESKVPALSVPLMMSNAAAGTLAMRYGLLGDTFGTVSACSASAHAIAQATRMIQYGDADAVITGGSEAALTPLSTPHSPLWMRCPRPASRARLTPGVTVSSWARAPLCSCWRTPRRPPRAGLRHSPPSAASAQPPTRIT